MKIRRREPQSDPAVKTGNMVNLSIPRAVDGIRTHDLFLTKEVLYQLSYNSKKKPVVPNPPSPNSNPSKLKAIRTTTRHFIPFFESGRWDLNPRQPAWKAGALPLSYTRNFPNANSDDRVRKNPFHSSMTDFRSEVRIHHSELGWAERDSNPRTPKRPDLQSGAIDRSAIRPTHNTHVFTGTAPEPSVGIEPTTYGLQNRCTTAVLRWRPPGKLQYRF